MTYDKQYQFSYLVVTLQQSGAPGKHDITEGSKYYNSFFRILIKWRDSIEDVLEVVFGRDSTEYKRFYDTRIKFKKTKRKK